MCLLLSTPYQQVQHHPETILEDVAKKLRRPILHLMDPQIFGLLLNSFTQTLRFYIQQNQSLQYFTFLVWPIAIIADNLMFRAHP